MTTSALGSRDLECARLAAIAVVVHAMEGFLPSPVPGVKPGLANIIVLVVLYRHGWRAACWVSLLRVCAGSLLIGTFLSPTFLLSLAGAIASLLAMGLLVGPPWRRYFGPLGCAALASVAHVCGQLLVAGLLLPAAGLLQLLPVLGLFALLLGIFSGTITGRVLQIMRPRGQHA